MKKRMLAGLLALCMVLTMLPATAFAAAGDYLTGWSQDSQTVKGESSDAVCEASGGSLHLKAQTGSGNGRGTDASGWPTVFVNETVNAALAAAKSGETRYVEMTFTPATDTNQPFGVFLNYSDPGNGFVIAYDWNGGWYWQPNNSSVYPNEAWYSGTRIPGPAVGAEVTLRLEWTDTELTLAKANDQDLFGGASVELPSSGSTAFGIRCSGSAEVTISSFQCGVVGSEEPNPPAVEKPAAPVASDLYDQNGSIKLFWTDVFCGKEAEGQGYQGNHWKAWYSFAISEVEANTEDNAAEYPYICKVTPANAPQTYVDDFNASAEHKHVLDEVRRDSLEAVLYYSAADQRWELLTDRAPNNGLRHEGEGYYLTIRMDRYATYTWETADGTQTQKVSLCKAVQDTVADPAAYTKDGKDYTFAGWTEGTDELGNPTYTAQYNVTDAPEPEYDGKFGETLFYKVRDEGDTLYIWGSGEISRDAFKGCRYKRVIIEGIDGNITVGKNAFYNSYITSVEFTGVNEIKETAFAHCTSLTNVTFHDDRLGAIMDKAFSNTALVNVTIPDDVALRNSLFEFTRTLSNVVLLGEPHLTWTDKVGYGESSDSVFREVYNTNPLFIYASGDAWMAKLAKLSKLGVNTYYIANLNGGVLDGTFETGKLATPVKEGYTFLGWYSGETALEKDGDCYVIPEGTVKGTVFTAKWGEVVELPAQPTNEQIAALNLYVDTWCVENAAGNGCDGWNLKKVENTAQYTLGDVAANEAENKAAYPYVCELTLTEEFVTECSTLIGSHTRCAEQKPFVAKLYCDTEGRWVLNESLAGSTQKENGVAIITENPLNPNVRKDGGYYYLDLMVENVKTFTWLDSDGTTVLHTAKQSRCVSQAEPTFDSFQPRNSINKETNTVTAFTEWKYNRNSLKPIYTAQYATMTVTPPAGGEVVWDDEAGTVTFPAGSTLTKTTTVTSTFTIPANVLSVTVPQAGLVNVKVEYNGGVTLPKGGTAILADGTVVTRVWCSTADNGVFCALGALGDVSEKKAHLCISGTGAMKDYTSRLKPTWTKSTYQKLVYSVNVMDGVTSIGDYAVYDCPNVAQVTIPDSVTRIGNYAFWSCKDALTTLDIPEGVTSIGEKAFYNCFSLENVKLPSTLTSIGDSAFWGCRELRELDLTGTALTSIGATALSSTPLQKIVLPATVKTVGRAAFGYCIALHSIVFLGAPTDVNVNAFTGIETETPVIIYVADDDTLAALADAIAKMPTGIEYYVANLNGHAFAEDAALAAKTLAAVSGTGVWVDETGAALSSSAIPEGAANGTVYRFVDTYTVTVDGEEHEVEYGSTLAGLLPADPAREGYTFAGWFCEGVKVDADTVVTGDMTIEPKWDINIYTVTVDGEEYEVEYGSTLAGLLPADPAREGYTFDGWFVGEDEVTADTVVTGAMTITSKWTQVPASALPIVPEIVVPEGPGEEIEDPDTPLADLPFVDVDLDAWYAQPIANVYAKGYMNGTSAMTFEPGLALNRGMMAKIIHNVAKNPAAAGQATFADVAGKYYADAVAWGAANGVLLGYNAETYGGEDALTREQMAAMLYRYAKNEGFAEDGEDTLDQQFTDGGQVSAWARDAMVWAVSEGLFQGRTNGALDPRANITRAEAAAVLDRFSKLFLA